TRNHLETWVRPLSHDATALLVLNRSGGSRSAKVRLSRVPGLPVAARYEARELWTGETVTLGPGGALRAHIARHGVAMWRIRPAGSRAAPAGAPPSLPYVNRAGG